MSAGPGKNRTKETLLIRADAGPRVGLGHVVRCSALGQAWKELGGNVIFLVPAAVPGLESRLRSDGFEVVEVRSKAGDEEDARGTIESAAREGCSWIVLDGYDFGPKYQTNLRASGTHLLYIDDYAHLDHYVSDIVLNQNIDSCPAMYAKRESYTRLLLGSSFVLLRREFLDRSSREREIPPVAQKVLLTMGGADPENATLKVLEALSYLSISGVEVAVILGPVNPHREAVMEELAHFPFAHHIFDSPMKISEVMGWADLALSGAGSTCWELAYMGVPTITLILAPNQEGIAQSLDERKISLNLRAYRSMDSRELAAKVEELMYDPERRARMSEKGRKLIDGQGAMRVCGCLRENEA